MGGRGVVKNWGPRGELIIRTQPAKTIVTQKKYQKQQHKQKETKKKLNKEHLENARNIKLAVFI